MKKLTVFENCIKYNQVLGNYVLHLQRTLFDIRLILHHSFYLSKTIVFKNFVNLILLPTRGKRVIRVNMDT